MRALPLCLLLGALCGIASAQNTSKTELAKRFAERKIDLFFSTVEKRTDIDAAVRSQVEALRQGATLGGEYGCIHQSLLLLYPEYKKADALLLHERYAAAADAFSALRSSGDPYLETYATYRYGLAQLNREHYLEAAKAFEEVLNEHRKEAGCDVDAAFYVAVAYGQAREKEKALAAAKQFLEDYPDAPHRYTMAMEQMRKELLQNWESPLYDLSSRMRDIKTRLLDGKTGEKTQGQEKKVVSILDELIKKAEGQEGKGQGNGGSGGNSRGTPSKSPSSPMNRSVAPPGASRTGPLHGKGEADPKSRWGEMRAKERQEALQSFKEKLPERYRKLLEDYDRALAEGRRVTDTPAPGQDDKGE